MNREQVENLEQANVTIEKMYHTLASIESHDYKEFLEDLSQCVDFENISDKLNVDVADQYYKDDMLNAMLPDYSLYGFVAEISMPKLSNFRFGDDGTFQSCSVNMGITRHEYVFGFDIDELVEKCVKIGNIYRMEQEDSARPIDV